MKSFCIAHLSDLHIGPNQTPEIERIKENLIEDLKSLIVENQLSLDSVAVTGDIVDKGGSELHYASAASFLKALFLAVDLPMDHLAIVPGNHDVPRRQVISELVEKKNVDAFSFQSKTEYEEYWETFGARFKRYREFVNGLVPDYCQYELGAGVKTIQSKDGLIVDFLLMNSSWLTTGDSDYGNIGIGRWQLEVVKKLKESKGKADLTLALLHHPLDWFSASAKKESMEFFGNRSMLGVDALLHGHIHNGSIDCSSNPDESILSLISGIGYPEGKGMAKLSRCRYALYKFNIDNGEVDIWLRQTNDSGYFAADTLLYKAAKESGRLTVPYRSALSINVESEMNIPMEVDPIPIVAGWVGRNEELGKILPSQIKLVAITGVGGQGKTALASEFLRRFARGEKSKFDYALWVNCRELPDSLHAKIIDVLEAISGGRETAELYRDEKLDDTVKRFLGHLQNKKCLIVLDNIDAYVDGESEAPKWELIPIMDMILSNQHKSKIIITCREPLNHHSSCFSQVPLTGLNVEDGIELFKNREIELIDKNSVDYCSKLVELINGHPWWLGLIAGQVKSGKDTLKNCVASFSSSEITPRGRIKEYFESVWEQQNKQRQKILRHLVEASRPLTIAEIFQALEDSGYATVQKEVRRLVRVGLMEPHEDTISKETIYYVHPLVREFVHETYSVAVQKQYVFRVLKIFLPQEIIQVLNQNLIGLGKLQDTSLSLSNLIDSIETCLHSRNLDEALALLVNFQRVIINGRRIHDFCSLTCQMLDVINWAQPLLSSTQDGVKLIQNNIDLLTLTGDFQRADHYLKRFDAWYERNSSTHLGYLLCKAHCYWVKGEFCEASKLIKQYDELVKSINMTPWINQDEQAVRALILRDNGDALAALRLFEKSKKNSDYSATDNGNMARCYQKMGQFEKAEKLLQDSLNRLKIEDSYVSRSNVGYAYQWIAEVYLEKRDEEKARAFTFLAKITWEEHAPGLLWHLSGLKKELFEGEIDFDKKEAIDIEAEFLNSNLVEAKRPM